MAINIVNRTWMIIRDLVGKMRKGESNPQEKTSKGKNRKYPSNQPIKSIMKPKTKKQKMCKHPKLKSHSRRICRPRKRLHTELPSQDKGKDTHARRKSKKSVRAMKRKREGKKYLC